MKSPLFFLSVFFILAVFLLISIEIGSSLDKDTRQGCYTNETGGLMNCSLSNDDFALFTQAGTSTAQSLTILGIFIFLVAFLAIISGLFLFKKLWGRN